MDIRPGLVMGTSGEEVQALHGALTVIGLQVEPEEREAQTFGASTVAAVIKLQALAGIEQSGTVDENTTAVVSLALDRLGIQPEQGGFAAAKPPASIEGTVTDGDGMPLAKATVVAFDCDLRDRVEIGRGRTDDTGAYRIAYKSSELIGERTVGDLQVEVRNRSGRVLETSPVAFNAPPTVTIDVPLGGAERTQPPEIATLTQTVEPLLGKLAPVELQEDDEHRDLSFLAGETGIEIARLASWTVAARLAAQTQLPSELFYGLLRCGVPTDASVHVLASSTAGVDFEANAANLLEAILQTSPATLASAVDHAIAMNVLPSSYAGSAEADLARLGQLAQTATLQSPQGFGKTSFASVLGAGGVTAKLQQQFIERYLAAPGGARPTFWYELAKDPEFSAKNVEDLRFAMTVGRLTRGHLPLIEALVAQRGGGQIARAADLARLTAKEWQKLLNGKGPAGTKIGAPPLIDAPTPAAAIETFAGMLERFFTRAYPTSALAARLAADRKSPFAAGAAVAALLDANPKVDLRFANIDHLSTTIQIEPEVRASMMAAQRLLKINPDYAVMSTLMADGINSAQQIYAMGRDRFVTMYGAPPAPPAPTPTPAPQPTPGAGSTSQAASGARSKAVLAALSARVATGATAGAPPALSATDAARTWACAEQTHAVAMAVALKLNVTLDRSSPAAIGSPLSETVAEKAAGYPNLQTLFGSESFCACEECESVLGAAAYLVDCLEFLNHRQASSGSVRDVLLDRRPDIALIELNCENTNTELPYIDLVNELLEDAVAVGPTSAAQRQTTLSTPELDANPEYPNDAAYEKLAQAVYPWALPFELPLAEARAYLGQIGLDRVELSETFRPPTEFPAAEARLDSLAIERLGFTALEADIVCAGPLAAANKPWDYWGLAQNANTITDPDDPTKTVSGTWLEVLAQVRVLLNRSGLTYELLAQLLNTIFVNGEETVTIAAEPPDSCDVATMTLGGLSEDVLERLHRFVRLMRRLEWDPYELDDAIAVLRSTTPTGLGQLDDLLLRQLAAVKQAMARFSLTAAQAVAFFAPAPTTVTIETRAVPTLPDDEVRYSLYHELFENLTVLNPPDPAFALNPQGTEIAAASTQLSQHTSGLVAALQVSETDLNTAIEAFTDGTLTLANLSALVRVTQLASALQVTIDELRSLLAFVEGPLTAAPHSAPIDPFDGTQPESMQAFADAAALLAKSGLTIEQVDYVVRGVERPDIAPDPVAVGTLLLSLWRGLEKIAGEYAFASDPLGAATRKALAKLLSSEALATVMSILDGSTTLSNSGQSSALTAALGPYLDIGSALTNLVGGAALVAGEPRFEYVLQAILAYQRRTLGTGLIVQTLAQSLGLSSATMALMLTDWFPSASTPGAFLIADLLALPTPTDTTAPVSGEDPSFAPYFAAYAALAKTASLIAALRLGDDDVAWWHSSGVGLGWLDPTVLPAAPTADAEGRFQKLARLQAARTVRDRVPISGATFQSLFDLAGADSKSAYFSTLIALTGWSADTLEVLCGDPANAADQGALSLAYPQDYLSETALARILPCEQTVARTGIPAEIGDWIAATVTAEAADAIKRSVKASYSDLQWPEIAKELRDGLRMQQRDALVAYLLANPPAGVARWLDAEDVFAHFLIDVEMCSCMATSRIVQATAAVQLFVQRCFLSLEPDVAVDVSTDGDWLQWQWMSQYRMWEANREVFLFPENWIDPSLRASKTPFFEELEQDLMQGELNDEAAQGALENYLEKLEAVARLDVVGTFHDMESGRETLHVLARSQGSPPKYYQRHWRDSSTWDAWEEVKLDIASDQVVPVTWNGRHYIFWAIVTLKPNRNNQPEPAAQTSSNPQPRPQTHLEIQLAWSQYKQGKWQGKQTAPQTLIYATPDFPPEWDASYVTLKTAFNGRLLEVDVFAATVQQLTQSGSGRIQKQKALHKGPIDVNNPREHIGSYILGGAGTGVEALVRNPEQLADAGGPSVADVGALAHPKPDIAVPTATRFDGDWLAPASTKYMSAQRPRTAPAYASYQLYSTLPSELLLNSADNFRLVVPHQTPAFDSKLPFFYRDQAREYFVVATPYYQNGNYFTLQAPAYVYDPFFKAQYTFWPFYHAFAGLLVAQLNMSGIDAMYERQLQLDPAAVQETPEFVFSSYYEPSSYVQKPYPTEGIDFEANAGYALYNWELFFHAPLLIANRLSTNQQFEDAKHWYEYVFDPASATTDPVPQRYWITKPFFQATAATYAAEQIDALMQAVNKHDPTLEHQVAAWRADPFDPDMIAQLRPVAYQRATVMKYIDNLIAWGDQLFMQDTRESINLATQLYVLAGELLGPRPETVAPRVEPAAKTYAELEGALDTFSNELVAAESAIPPVKVNVPTPPSSPPLPSVNTLYFRIPPNSQLLGYWDTVADRLFKIRHCMNIEGVVQQLSLFAPPINPGALIAAAAAGLDLASVLSDSEAALPPYRFRTIIRHALDLCAQVQQLGAMLLAALEKSDAEQLARIRSGGERELQSAIEVVRTQQVEEASKQLEVLAKSQQSASDRLNWYSTRGLMNTWEELALGLQGGALVSQAIAVWLDGTAAVAHVIPTFEFGAAGFGGTPSVNAKLGGKEVGHAANSGAWVARMIAGALQTGAEMSATVGRYQQRHDEWGLQATLAKDDIARIEAETTVANLKLEIAKSEKAAQEISVKEAEGVDEFLHSKFTDKELYDWMVGQTATTYFQAYQLAYSIAKQAERCYRRELAIEDSEFIQFGYWDSLRKGLTAGEKLHYDLRRLESAYLTGNDRELELVKHVSLLQIDPLALVALRETGTCLVSVPEILFDLDNPGHYMRRLKSVAVSVPCVVGPYTGVSMTVGLLRNQTRTTTDISEAALITDNGGTSEIVTSSGQHDDGMFELRFEDERYLPFEGSGAISTWRLTLNNVRPQFDYETITDVVLHLRFTARDGGAAFGQTVKESVGSHLNSIALEGSREGLYRLFSARHDFAAEWTQFLNPAPGADQVLTLQTPPERFPFFTAGLDLKAHAIDVIARTTDGGAYDLVLTPPGGTAKTVTVNPDPTLDGANHYATTLSPAPDIGRAPSPVGVTPPTWTIKLKQESATDYRSLTASEIEDLLVVISYQAT